MKFSSIAVALLAIVALASCATPQKQAQTDIKHLRIATEGAYAPFNYVASDGSLQGFEVDLAHALCAQMQADCTIVQQQWDGMIPNLVSGKYDAIIASMSITNERKRVIAFSEPYYNTPAVLVAKKGTRIVLGGDGNPTIGSFKGLAIGVQVSTIHENYAARNFPGVRLVRYATSDEADAALLAGEVDARFDDILALYANLLKNHGADYTVYGKGYYGDELGNGVGIGLRKEDAALRGAFDNALDAIYADGTYRKINAKYFAFDLYFKPGQ
ncbi:MAG TPA: transporter substrate-binding domain-containing protein [Terriglobales bacterium]|nr:transporter substrate-binding domain-containing protein [Terriglobales bacterium]